MRHFAESLRAARAGLALHARWTTPATAAAWPPSWTPPSPPAPAALVLTAPGDWRVLQALRGVARQHGLPLDLRDDRHFFSTVRDFADHARGRKQLRMEYFYREMRQRHRVLMDGDQPCGGQWNFDADNREAFGRRPRPAAAAARVRARCHHARGDRAGRTRFADHPGRLDDFAWPVTPRRRRCRRCTTSSPSACRTSAAGRTRCGPASPGCTTRTWPRR
jgi:deoxyribodipyrimidine photolyase-related protein